MHTTTILIIYTENRYAYFTSFIMKKNLIQNYSISISLRQKCILIIVHFVRLKKIICMKLFIFFLFSIKNQILTNFSIKPVLLWSRWKPTKTKHSYLFLDHYSQHYTINERCRIYSYPPFLPGFCKSMKRDTDKVVMVYTVEVTDAMTPKQWLHGQFQNVN